MLYQPEFRRKFRRFSLSVENPLNRGREDETGRLDQGTGRVVPVRVGPITGLPLNNETLVKRTLNPGMLIPEDRRHPHLRTGRGGPIAGEGTDRDRLDLSPGQLLPGEPILLRLPQRPQDIEEDRSGQD